MLGDETRIRILYSLWDSKKCVGDLAGALGITDSAASHQLRELRLAGLVRMEKVGQRTYYSAKGTVIDLLRHMQTFYL